MSMKILILTLFFEIKESKITRGHNFTLVKKQSRLDVRKFSFSQRTINVWNSQSRGQFRFCNSIPIPVISIPIQFRLRYTKSLRQFNSNSDDGNSTPIPVNSVIHSVIVIILAYFFKNYLELDSKPGVSWT